MGWNYRRRINLGGGVHLNLSKHGIGMSVGVKGMRAGVGPRGAYRTLSIPGTGIYNTKYAKKASTSKKAPKQFQPQETNRSEISETAQRPKGLGSLAGWGFLTTTVSIILLFVWWPAGIAGIVGWIVYCSRSPIHKANKAYTSAKSELKKLDYDGAIDEFTKTLELRPAAVSVYKELAQTQITAGKYAEGVQSFEKYLGTYPDDLMEQFEYAAALALVKQYDKSIVVLQGLPAELRQELSVINLMALGFVESGKPELALEVLSTGPIRKRTMDDNMMAFRYLLAKTYSALGQKDKAIRELNKVCAHDINFEDARELLAKLTDSEDK